MNPLPTHLPTPDASVTHATPGDASAAAPSPPGAAAPVPCPLCEYDLRGLAEPRCPECGYRFSWDELRDPTRRFHPYLFEHHPERNISSLFETLTRGVTPAAFWSTLYPTQPSRPSRVVAYWVLCALPLVAAAAGLAWFNVSGMLAGMQPRQWAPFRFPWASFLRWATRYDIHGGAMILTALMCLAWPWLTLAALLVFRISMRRARLHWTHVLRCVLYAGDVAFWCAFPLALVALFALVGNTWPTRSPLGEAWPLVPVAISLWLIYRLFTAYRLYLRFDHALATVAASQVMVGLVFWKMLYTLMGY